MSKTNSNNKGQQNTNNNKPNTFLKGIVHIMGYGFFAVIQRLRFPYASLKKKAVKNREVNMSKNIKFPLNGQGMGELKDMRIGSCTFAHSGCGAIATFNAMSMIGREPKIEEIVDFYEHNGLILNARMGVNPSGVKRYLKSRNVKWEFYSGKNDWDSKLSKEQVAIVLYWWVNRKGCGAHYIAMERTDEGICVYNEFGNRDTVYKYKDIQTFLTTGQYKRMVAMFVIDRKEN